MNTVSSNPLAKHFRQPKIYIKLPSNGEYYDNGLEKTENGEYPVLGMTARDELMDKTPDALLNGQATVDVIQSCFPHIKNAWNVPSIDLDAILIAIRIATFGEKLDITFKVPGLNEERLYEVDLRILLDQIQSQTYANVLQINDCTIELRPTSYRFFTNIALKTFEQQRIFSLLRDNNISEQEKLEKIQDSFSKLTDMNLELIKNSILSVGFAGEPSVTNREHIEEFVNNSEKEIFSAIIQHVETEKNKFSLKPLTVTFSKEDQEKGAPETLEVPVLLDQSNFFGKGS
jgi:hypothetical protein